MLQEKSHIGGNLIILGRPWLAIADAYISCHLGSMTVSDGTETKSLTLYPKYQPILEAKTPLWVELEEEYVVQPLLTIGKALTFKDET